MAILTVNTGSSSVKLAAFDADLNPLRAQTYRADEGEPEALLCEFGSGFETIVHRVVHGGRRFSAPCVLDDKAQEAIAQLSPLAPLHNPRALRWIEAARAVFGGTQVAVFDTAFYADLPDVAATYALPRALCEQHGIRRFGFHGLAHQSMAQSWRELQRGGGRVISLQLGSGCSITATLDGKPLDTSMGFSPLEGLVMATRVGDVDAGALLYLQREANLGADELETMLNRESGLLGVSGVSDDMRQLLARDDENSRLAVALYCYRARKYVGAYLAVLGGADAILFGGGVGENAASVRAQILGALEWCGLSLDDAANSAATAVPEPTRISAPGSAIEAWIMPVDEALTMARAARGLGVDTA